MPRLKDKAITLLGTSGALNTQTAAGAQTVYTSEPGKTTYITHVVLRAPTASMAGATVLTFGVYMTGNFSANSVTTVTTGCVTFTNGTAGVSLPASTAFQMTPSTGTAGASTCVFDVFGFTR
jgi:hypothetical protein